jgi:coproporphyrinogen III oxidase-like Fe-S oxidoreductase
VQIAGDVTKVHEVLSSRVLGAYMRRVNRKAMNFGAEEELSLTLKPAEGRSYLLYVHIPFCEVLCPFCAFHRVEYTSQKALPYFDALRAEIRHYRERGFTFSDVYIGGGTPTINAAELAETIALIRAQFPVRQVSIETNPNHLDAERLRVLREGGVDRVSVGVQSFDDELLKNMQRYDKYGSGAQIVDRLQAVSGIFKTLNVDMMFNLPRQSAESLVRDLDTIRRLNVDQVSFYPLMAATPTRRRIAREMGVAGEDHEKVFYRMIRRAMSEPYRPSSGWCFSRTAGMVDEYIVDHEEYVGVGSGAFSYVDGHIYATTFSIPRYRELIPRRGTAITQGRALTRLEQHRYHFMMTLFGLSMSKEAARQRFGDAYFRTLWREFLVFRMLGALREEGDLIRLTDRGMYYWVIMMREFLTGVNRLRDEMRWQQGRPVTR